ncbi:hypothetical protein DAEQUDRAFT_770490 [Daedalea quercina L-15889]|uniref:Uncharacterized protein n=1 Tax=Daedalea quercina L-15889 TaxID=1314783 RepID=A0A165KU16_9APHY|nr:hypothetical protein DAEQUDRAFT_770490 [Daedalea quercina L-15889]
MADVPRKTAKGHSSASAQPQLTKSPAKKTNVPKEIKESLKKVSSPQAAVEALHKYQLIPEGESPNMAALSTGLLHLAASKNLGATIIEALCAFSTYVKELHENALAERIWERIRSVYTVRDEQREQIAEIIGNQEHVQREVEGTIGRLSTEVRNLLQSQTNLATELEDVKHLKTDLTETIDMLKQTASQPEPPAREPTYPPTQDRNNRNKASYAATVMHILPTLHATSVARQDAQIRKVLIDIKKRDNADPDVKQRVVKEWLQ